MKNIAELHTIRDFIRWGTSRFNAAGLFYGHGTDSAFDEAAALVLHTVHLPHTVGAAVLDARLTMTEREEINQLIQRRIDERIPLPYLTREAWFAGHSFYVDERVLIPRSPLAELIENECQPWVMQPPHKILDLCTGSGCIAIACAKVFPDSIVYAADISEEALAVAKINVLRHHAEAAVHLVQSDLFEKVPPEKFDLIISNPPYVDAADMAELPPEFRHEPVSGLAAGEDGLDIVLRILEQARDYLTPDGILIVEVGNSELALAEKCPDLPFAWLDFERGGGGVFLLTREQLEKHY